MSEGGAWVGHADRHRAHSGEVCDWNCHGDGSGSYSGRGQNIRPEVYYGAADEACSDDGEGLVVTVHPDQPNVGGKAGDSDGRRRRDGTYCKRRRRARYAAGVGADVCGADSFPGGKPAGAVDHRHGVNAG